MNINLEKLYAEMKDRPWNTDIEPLLASLRSKHLTGNFPIPFVKVKLERECGIALLPQKDFPIFGIDPKNDSFDLALCSKCNIHYRLQSVKKHLKEHTRVRRSQLNNDSLESTSSLSQPTTPTKASKKEMPKIAKKFVLSPPELIPPVDIILSDPDISSSSGDNSFPSDGSNLSSNGLIAAVKTEDNINVMPVSFATSNSGLQSKSKPPPADRSKKTTAKDIKESKKALPASKTKEYDPNRHCGVRTEENGWTPCLRSLTCKSHTVFLRRSVPGRIKSFDELLLEHKQSKGSKTVPPIKITKKKTLKDSVILHSLTSAHVQLTPLPSPVPSPIQYVPVSPVQERVKEEPMLVDEMKEEKPVMKYEVEEPMPLAPLPVTECTTRVRRSRQQPQPLGISRVSVCIHNNRVFTNPREASYWMKLLSSTSQLKNTININSIKNNLYPAQFFNLMNASDQVQNGANNFIPMNNSRFNFSSRGELKQ